MLELPSPFFFFFLNEQNHNSYVDITRSTGSYVVHVKACNDDDVDILIYQSIGC